MKITKINETVLHGMVMETVNKILAEVYDEHMLDGITYIDSKSLRTFVEAMISNNNRGSRFSPYQPVKQLVLYFSPEGAMKHGGRLVKDVVKYIMKDKDIMSHIYQITEEDKKINEIIYGPEKLNGSSLIEALNWHLQTITEQIQMLMVALDKSNIRNYFQGTEAIDGSADGKRLGLGGIMLKAYMGINKIQDQMKKLEEILSNGKDPMSYKIGKTVRK